MQIEIKKENIEEDGKGKRSKKTLLRNYWSTSVS